METKLCGNLYSLRTLLVELEYLIIIRKQFSNWLNSSRENWLCAISLDLKKMEKEAKFWEIKINLYSSPHTGLRIRWNFATVSSRLRDPVAQPLKNEEMEKNEVSRGKTEWLVFAPQASHNYWFGFDNKRKKRMLKLELFEWKKVFANVNTNVWRNQYIYVESYRHFIYMLKTIASLYLCWKLSPVYIYVERCQRIEKLAA